MNQYDLIMWQMNKCEQVNSWHHNQDLGIRKIQPSLLSGVIFWQKLDGAMAPWKASERPNEEIEPTITKNNTLW